MMTHFVSISPAESSSLHCCCCFDCIHPSRFHGSLQLPLPEYTKVRTQSACQGCGTPSGELLTFFFKVVAIDVSVLQAWSYLIFYANCCFFSDWILLS